MSDPKALETADPRIRRFVASLEPLSTAEWATICGRYAAGYADIARASSAAVAELAGIGSDHGGGSLDTVRLEEASRVYSACVAVAGELPEYSRVAGIQFPLRALAKIAIVDTVRALLVIESFLAHPATRSHLIALMAPFQGFAALPAVDADMRLPREDRKQTRIS